MSKATLPLLFLVVLLVSSCRTLGRVVKEKTLTAVAGALAGGVSDGEGNVFTRDNDPDFVAESFPFLLKIYELVISQKQDSADLNLAAGEGFVSYAAGFIEGRLKREATIEEKKQAKARAKKLYLRGRGFLFDAIDLRHSGFTEMLLNEEEIGVALEMTNREDVPILYWMAAAWLGAYATNPFDFEIASGLHIPVALLYRALQLDEDYKEGAIHKVLITLNESLPGFPAQVAWASPQLASFARAYYGPLQGRAISWFHFYIAERLSKGLDPSLYVTMAEKIAVKKQDHALFSHFLARALKIDADRFPGRRLSIILFQEKARKLKKDASRLFLEDPGS